MVDMSSQVPVWSREPRLEAAYWAADAFRCHHRSNWLEMRPFELESDSGTELGRQFLNDLTGRLEKAVERGDKEEVRAAEEKVERAKKVRENVDHLEASTNPT